MQLSQSTPHELLESLGVYKSKGSWLNCE